MWPLNVGGGGVCVWRHFTVQLFWKHYYPRLVSKTSLLFHAINIFKLPQQASRNIVPVTSKTISNLSLFVSQSNISYSRT